MTVRATHIVLLLLALLLLPHLWVAGAQMAGASEHWSRLSWDSAGLAPDPATTPEALVQVYSARAYGWRGVFGEHSWLVAKAAGAPAFERYEVVGWGVGRGASAIRRNGRAPDGRWAGNEPRVLAELRGADAEAVIAGLEAAIERYPFADRYRVWPGPNSNTFVAHLAREIPELSLHLPPTAIGKDYLTNGGVLARTPSGTGYQLSLFGLAGIALARTEGLELNILGLTLGIDPLGLAIKLPGIGRIGLT